MRTRSQGNLTIAFIITLLVGSVAAQTSQFSYQGSLNNGGASANGNYDFEFALFDALNGGNQVGPTVSRNSVVVTNGTFSVLLDFGNTTFPGAARFLEIRVRPSGQPGITILSPRQAITSAPYSIKSSNADLATNSTQLGGVAANQFVQTNDTRLSDARTPTAGSGDYIQNRNTTQAATNFNISGNGTVGGTFSGNIINATTQFNLGNTRVLSTAGSSNLFVGPNAGAVNTATGNTFVGDGAGNSNTTGFSNTFVGASGGSNTTGRENAFFGYGAGAFNTTGNYNAFFGRSAGYSNVGADYNSFFGFAAGNDNSTGSQDSFFGYRAGYNNTSGSNNSFFGNRAGDANTTASFNSFFGAFAGYGNTTGVENSFFGESAGQNNTTGDYNSYFGRNAGTASTTGYSNAFFGTSAGVSNTTGFNDSFLGRMAGRYNTTGGNNTFTGSFSGEDNTTGNSNAFFGAFAGNSNTTGSNNTILGAGADVGEANLTFATAVGAGAIATLSNAVVLGRASDYVIVPGLLQVNNYFSGTQNLCRSPFNFISTCSSSLRYKRDVETFTGGLDLVRRLRPISFTWIEGGARDVGFAAEEVNDVEPLLVTFEKGRIEGVKYGQVTTVLVNAVKEQQEQIEQQRKMIDAQQKQIEAQQKQIEELRLLMRASLSRQRPSRSVKGGQGR